jgi:anti-sigma factor RsiW
MDRLPAPQRAELERHLNSCMSCNAALAEIAPVAHLLPTVDPRRIVQTPTARPEVATRLFSRIAEEKRQARRKQWLTSSAIGVAAAVLVAVLIVPLSHVGGGSRGEDVAFASPPANVHATSRLVNESWGTEIHLKATGLTGRQTVWFEQADGTRASAGSFEAGDGQPVDLVLSTAFKSDDAVALCVSPPNAPAVLRAPLGA